MKDALLTVLAKVTRHFHPRGSERILRFFYHPDRITSPIHTVIRYWGNLQISVDTSYFLGWRIFFFGSYEPDTVAFIEKNVHAEDVCIDIGANIGVHALILSKIAKEVHAFEPCSKPRQKLNENLQLNNIKNVTVYPDAVSDVSKTSNLVVQEKSSTKLGSATLYGDDSLDILEQETVRVRTLDSYKFKRVDFLKIDTEGGELHVLRGAEDTLRRCNPIILFEYSENLWQNADSSLQDVVSFLQEIGYPRILSLGKNGKTVSLENKKAQNIVALPHTN
ncbi:FkbM family methyltransferase [bacterium]|nr:MAG: FkbM family methyltransferase [bacterium]